MAQVIKAPKSGKIVLLAKQVFHKFMKNPPAFPFRGDKKILIISLNKRRKHYEDTGHYSRIQSLS